MLVYFPLAEPAVRNGRPPSSHSVHSFLNQYAGSFKKPPIRRPHSVIGDGLGIPAAATRNGGRLGNPSSSISLASHRHINMFMYIHTYVPL